jgi:N-acetylneuraminic acid mutarotase
MLQRAECNMKPGRVWILLGLNLIGLLGTAFICLAAGDAWTSKADMPTPRSGLSTVVVNGKIYAIGGTDMQMAWQIGNRWMFGSSVVEEYDPVRDIWTKKTNMPALMTNPSINIANGKIYVIGGTEGMMRQSSTVEEYDPATDTWTQKADMPTSRSGIATAVVNERIYAIGGMMIQAAGARIGRTTLSTVEEYDPITDIWTQKADMPTPRSEVSTAVVNGKIYVFGGMDMQAAGVRMGQAALSTVEEYDPATDTWTQKADIPTPRLSPSVIVVGKKIYVIGGAEGMMAASSIVEEYDPARDIWTEKTDIPTPRTDVSISVADGKIYVIGGSEAQAAGAGMRQEIVLSTVEEYDPVRDNWEQKEDMPTARSGLSTSTVNGKIYAVGGAAIEADQGRVGQSISLSTVEEYTPEGWSPFSVSPRGKLATVWGAIRRGE